MPDQENHKFYFEYFDKEYQEMRHRDITLKYFFKVWPVSTSCAVRRLRSIGIDISLEKVQEIFDKPESELDTMDRYYLTQLIQLIQKDMSRIKDCVIS